MKVGYYNTIDGFLEYKETTKESLNKDVEELYLPLLLLKKHNLIKKFGTCVVVMENNNIIYQCGSL